MTTFEFKPFLRQLDPTSDYDIVKLTGGLVNLTSRATKAGARNETNNASNSLFQGHDSVVLKYAPPYVHAIGESAPFSTYRQASYPYDKFFILQHISRRLRLEHYNTSQVFLRSWKRSKSIAYVPHVSSSMTQHNTFSP